MPLRDFDLPAANSLIVNLSHLALPLVILWMSISLNMFIIEGPLGPFHDSNLFLHPRKTGSIEKDQRHEMG